MTPITPEEPFPNSFLHVAKSPLNRGRSCMPLPDISVMAGQTVDTWCSLIGVDTWALVHNGQKSTVLCFQIKETGQPVGPTEILKYARPLEGFSASGHQTSKWSPRWNILTWSSVIGLIFWESVVALFWRWNILTWRHWIQTMRLSMSWCIDTKLVRSFQVPTRGAFEKIRTLKIYIF